jgi:hypothetical protein
MHLGALAAGSAASSAPAGWWSCANVQVKPGGVQVCVHSSKWKAALAVGCCSVHFLSQCDPTGRAVHIHHTPALLRAITIDQSHDTYNAHSRAHSRRAAGAPGAHSCTPTPPTGAAPRASMQTNRPINDAKVLVATPNQIESICW